MEIVLKGQDLIYLLGHIVELTRHTKLWIIRENRVFHYWMSHSLYDEWTTFEKIFSSFENSEKNPKNLQKKLRIDFSSHTLITQHYLGA